MIFWTVLMCFGLLLACVGHLWLVVVSFRQSVLWGFGVLFVPFAVFFFLARYWEDAKQPFLSWMLGVLLVAVPMILNWDTLNKQKDFAEQIARAEGKPAATPAPEQKPETPLMKQDRLERQKAAFVQHAADLKAKYDALQAQWAKLAPGDKAGRAAFDQEAAVYQAMRKQVEIEKAEVEAPPGAAH